MSMVKGAIGALVGTLVGAAVWVAISYGTSTELGIVAWGLGAAAGFCSWAVVREESGAAHGLIAAVIAVAGIGGAKYVSASLRVGDFLNELETLARAQAVYDDPAMEERAADSIIAQREQDGKAVVWPEGVDSEDAQFPDQYPADVVKAARAEWKKLDEQGKEFERDAAKAEFEDSIAVLHGTSSSFTMTAFENSFDYYDILWCFLAAASAWRLGTGSHAE